MEIRSAFSPHVRVARAFDPKESRTKQSFKKECDVNNIMAKYQKTGAISHFNRREGQYADATGLDFTNAMLLITETQQMFNELPSSIRNRFGNDPSAFLDFVQDPNNAEEMEEMGLRETRSRAELSALEPDPLPNQDARASESPPAAGGNETPTTPGG